MTVLLQINFLTATVNAVTKIKNVDLKIAFHFQPTPRNIEYILMGLNPF